jgi:hypothetical protein
MSFINWGHETLEQKEIRRKLEERAIQEHIAFKRLMEARGNSSSAATAAGVAGSGVNFIVLQTILAKLNSRYSEITDLVPNIYKFWDDYTSGENFPILPGINDGGDDMYDGGNYLNTNLTNSYDTLRSGGVDDGGPIANASIPYTHTQPDNEDDENENENPPMDGKVRNGNSYFGAGSAYFTNMYPGLFIMVADSTSVSEFSITGDVGSDSDTVNAGGSVEVVPDWTLFYKTNFEDSEDSDPTINHLILIPGTPDGITHEFEDDDGDDYDDHVVMGISDRSRIVFAAVATQPGAAVLSESELIQVAEKILDIVIQ